VASRAQPVTDLERNDITDDGASWLAAARTAVLARLAGGAELSAKELRKDLAELTGEVSWYEHKPYGQALHVAPRVLTWLSATGDLMRGRNAGPWRTTRPLGRGRTSGSTPRSTGATRPGIR
jgi:hypothetical protein